MLLGAEDRGATVVALVASHPFEHGEPVVQAVSQDMNGGLVVRHHRSVHPDFVGAQIVRRHSPNKTSRWRVHSRAGASPAPESGARLRYRQLFPSKLASSCPTNRADVSLDK